MINNNKIEICLGNIQDIETLNKYPVDRIELNSALELGGLTPSLSTLIKAKSLTNIQIVCMVRSRGGNFCYTKEEYDTMYQDAELLLRNGADGIVFGFLNEDLSFNDEQMIRFAKLAKKYNKEAICHKAFDVMTSDINDDVEKLIKYGITRVLTSGRAVYPDIIGGAKVINELNAKYGNKIQFLPGGGIRIDNVKDVYTICNTHQAHMTSKKKYDGDYIGLDEEQLQGLLNKIKELQ